jgi:hypothetical protein
MSLKKPRKSLIFPYYRGEMVLAGAGIFDKLEPELVPHKNVPAPQYWFWSSIKINNSRRTNDAVPIPFL